MTTIIGQPYQSGLDYVLGKTGEGLGSGLQQGLAQFHERKQLDKQATELGKYVPKDKALAILKAPKELQKTLLQQALYEKEFPSQPSSPTMTTDEEQPMGAPQHENKISSMSDDQLNRLLANPLYSKVAESEIKRRQQEKKLQQTEKLAYTKMNEKPLTELNERLTALEGTDTELERLNDLFTEGKFPSSFTAAMFDLEGDTGLSDFGRSQLSEDAQEAVKIIASQIRGISKIFPGRILQSEVQNFMKTLPGLINTPKGRERITRGMRIFNKMAQVQSQAVMNEFEKAGGSGAIPYSEALQKARKAAAPEINQLKKLYLNPNQTEFETFPPAWLYKGKESVDEETGQKFKSDGNEWIPISS